MYYAVVCTIIYTAYYSTYYCTITLLILAIFYMQAGMSECTHDM